MTCLTAVEQARLIRTREVSAVELVTAHLERIYEVNPSLNAAVEVLHESALEAARAADNRREPPRPLEGVPFSIKDSIEVEGTVCSAGTLGLQHCARSQRDATLVARLRAAGAIPIARTNLPDLLFAFESDNLIYGRTNNPHDLSRTSGGSSGGEAALIAAGGSPFGLGSDCAGSVRVPAHYCGISSIKPTSGRLPRTGHVPPAGGWLEMLWQIGPMARRVEDLCTLMPILTGPDGHDLTVKPVPVQTMPDIAELRIAFFTDNGIAPVDCETAAMVRRAVRALEGEVAYVEEHRPDRIEESFELEMKLIGPDGGDGLRQYLADIGSIRTHALLEAWLQKLEPYRTDIRGFGKYWEALDAFRSAMNRTLDTYDAILSPVSASPAVHHGTSTEDSIFRGFSYTMSYNLTGWPAAVVPFGKSQDGLPIGVQIAAAPWREDIALAVALRLEAVNALR